MSRLIRLLLVLIVPTVAASCASKPRVVYQPGEPLRCDVEASLLIPLPDPQSPPPSLTISEALNFISLRTRELLDALEHSDAQAHALQQCEQHGIDDGPTG